MLDVLVGKKGNVLERNKDEDGEEVDGNEKDEMPASIRGL